MNRKFLVLFVITFLTIFVFNGSLLFAEILNPGFEDETGWTQNPGCNRDQIIYIGDSNFKPLTGNGTTFFYARSNCLDESTLVSSSQIAIPADVGLLQLWLKVGKDLSWLIGNPPASGSLQIKIDNNLIETYTHDEVGTFKKNEAGGWVKKEIDISAFAGAEHTIEFRFKLDSFQEIDDGSADLFMMIDDLALIVPCDVIADFTAEPTTITIGDAVTFTNTSTGDVANTTAKWLWDFDTEPAENAGIKTSTEKTPQPVTFDEARAYKVKLTATGTDNCQTFFEQDITVNCDVQAAMSGPSTAKVDQQVTFINDTDTTGTGINPTYTWDVIKGTESNGTVVTNDTSEVVIDLSGTDPGFKFQKTGTYTVKLTATSPTGSGCSTTATQEVNVECNVTARFSIENDDENTNSNSPGLQIKVGTPISINNLSEIVGTVTELKWDFGSSEINDIYTKTTIDPPIHTYELKDTPVNLNIKLTATGAGGCTTEYSQPVEIICDSSANFIRLDGENSLIVYSGQAVTFQNTSSGEKSVEWYFGDVADETPETGETATHTYNNTGEYQFRLDAIGTAGCRTSTPPEGMLLTVIPALGNVNGDESLDLKDAVNALQVAAGFTNISGINFEYSDVNNDKKVGLEEAVYVLQKVSGLR